MISSNHSKQVSIFKGFLSPVSIIIALLQFRLFLNFNWSICAVTAGGFEAKGTLDQKVGELSYSDSVYAFIDSLNVLHNVKFTVAEMVTSVSNYFQHMFGYFTGQTSSSGIDASGNTKANLMDPITMRGTFMGLAVLVMIVIMFKRA